MAKAIRSASPREAFSYAPPRQLQRLHSYVPVTVAVWFARIVTGRLSGAFHFDTALKMITCEPAARPVTVSPLFFQLPLSTRHRAPAFRASAVSIVT